jgi:S1-C subfamily serine protease
MKSIVLAALLCCSVSPLKAATLPEVIDGVQPKIAKLYGAGGVRGLEAYQSGVLVSPSGHILTAWSTVLDTDTVTVVLNDGRRYEAVLAGADPRMAIALLKPREEMDSLPYFDLEGAKSAGGGTRILAFSNCFSVAAGDEAASVQKGVVLAVVPLNARRGVFEAAYRGPVYVLDAVTSNPGAAGGAITDDDGALVGLIGPELRSNVNGTWLNYALPIEELRATVARLQAGEAAPVAPNAQIAAANNPVQLSALGVTLLPNVLDRTPAFIDVIAEDSPAALAGLRPDDLIIMIDGKLFNSRAAFEQELAQHEANQPLKLGVIRSGDVVEVTLEPKPH